MRRNSAVGQQRFRRRFGTVFLGKGNAQARTPFKSIGQELPVIEDTTFGLFACCLMGCGETHAAAPNGAAMFCPAGLIPGIHQRRVLRIFRRAGRARSTISRANSTNPPDGQITQKSVKPLLKKYSDFPKLRISLYPSHPVPHRGAFRERHGRRGGMRWTQRCARRATLLRTVKSCGPDTSTLVSSLR